MAEENMEKLSQLDLGSLSVGDLSNLKNTIFRAALIGVAQRGDTLEFQTSHQNHGQHADHITHQSSAELLLQ